MTSTILAIDAYECYLGELGTPRSPKWPAFREAVLAERGRKSELSGSTTELELHHVIPFHFGVLLQRPYIELDRRNVFIVSNGPTVNEHLLLGHFDSWQSYNIDVRECGKYLGTTPPFWTAAAWRDLVNARPKAWGHMDTHDKQTLTAMIDRLYPL